uniref:Uncharacterized protein n=1 Tax=Arundo donax TaxID=35708 RepID=A0A0A8Z7T3_ARUDO
MFNDLHAFYSTARKRRRLYSNFLSPANSSLI